MMFKGRKPWQEELEIVDRTMRAISGITDPEELVNVYWEGIGGLLPPIDSFVSLSRRGVEPPGYLITRSSRFTEDINPWTQRDRLPRLSGGLLGELAYANRPMLVDDIPGRLTPDDPGHLYLDGFQSLVALPPYDAGGAQNLVLRNQLSAALASLDRELQVVGEIQRSLLPSELPAIDGFELAAYYLTSARAGGDYYDFFPLPGGAWGIFIADVSGHGTPAAVLMAITHAIAHARSEERRVG